MEFNFRSSKVMENYIYVWDILVTANAKDKVQ